MLNKQDMMDRFDNCFKFIHENDECIVKAGYSLENDANGEIVPKEERLQFLDFIETEIQYAIAQERKSIRAMIPREATGDVEPWATKEQQDEQNIYAHGFNDCRERFISSITSISKKSE